MTIIYIVICGIAFLIGMFAKPPIKKEVLIPLLVLTPSTVIITFLIASGLENSGVIESFISLVSFDAQSARASFGIYVASALFCYFLGLLLNGGRA